MKVWALAPNESWICDRFVDEWNSLSGFGTPDPISADVIWLLSDWVWNQVPLSVLTSGKPIIASIHHLVPDKFGPSQLSDFVARDRYVTAYHVPCKKTETQVRDVLNRIGVSKQIFTQPFWVNGDVWRSIADSGSIRKSLGIESHEIACGSFQRDTEGADLVSPKLEKGPDLFCDAIIGIRDRNPQMALKVVLAGWRRQYVIRRLRDASIPFVYEERPSLERVNELYNALDAYIVAARYEGGPQAIVECAAIGVPIVSRDVGLAAEILHSSVISDDLVSAFYSMDDAMTTEHAMRNVSRLLIPDGFEPFKEFFSKLVKQ
jgi:glycosyltransferase involved in cell wall biosynthesis